MSSYEILDNPYHHGDNGEPIDTGAFLRKTSGVYPDSKQCLYRVTFAHRMVEKTIYAIAPIVCDEFTEEEVRTMLFLLCLAVFDECQPGSESESAQQAKLTTKFERIPFYAFGYGGTPL